MTIVRRGRGNQRDRARVVDVWSTRCICAYVRIRVLYIQGRREATLLGIVSFHLSNLPKVHSRTRALTLAQLSRT